MKKILFALILLVLAENVFAVPATATISSPIEGQVFTVGDEIQLSFSSNVNMQAFWVSGKFNGNWIYNTYVSFPDNDQTEYVQTIDTTNFPAGAAQLRVSAGYLIDPNDPSSYQMIPDATVNFILLDNSEAIEQGSITVIRSVPDEVYIGGLALVNIIIKPSEQFPGIILTETLDDGLEYEYFLAGNAPVEINDMEKGQTVKFVMMSKENIPFNSFVYTVKISEDNGFEPGDEILLTGTWAIEGAEGEITGDTKIKIAGFAIPACPLTDQQLLKHIGDWAESKINNLEILQVVQRWKECQNPMPV